MKVKVEFEGEDVIRNLHSPAYAKAAADEAIHGPLVHRQTLVHPIHE